MEEADIVRISSAARGAWELKRGIKLNISSINYVEVSMPFPRNYPDYA